MKRAAESKKVQPRNPKMHATRHIVRHTAGCKKGTLNSSGPLCSPLRVPSFLHLRSPVTADSHKTTIELYLLCLVTVMVHVQVVVSSRDLKLTATQPYPRLSPSSKSCTRNRSRLFRVLLASITHDEYSLRVMHSFFIMFRYAVTVVFNNVYVFSDSKLISGLRAPPEHSTSCMLEMFLKLLTLIPASDPEK